MAVFLGSVKKEFTFAEIEYLANGKKVKVVIPSLFDEIEYAVVEINKFTSAFFLMDNQTFKYKYSHTYNAMTDKKTKRLPKGF
jgi:hypothetical protein